MYKLVFRQKYQENAQEEFLVLEREFQKFEREDPKAPKGKRYAPYLSAFPQNMLIWECEFDTLEEAIRAKQFLEENQTHEELLRQQIRYFVESYAEIYKEID